MRASELSALVKRRAGAQGFERCGIAPAAPLDREAYVRRWLASGRAGTMDYLHRHVEQRLNPTLLLDGARSVVAVALVYYQQAEEPQAAADSPQSAHGRIAMYAWGEDYHVVVKDKLFALMRGLTLEIPYPFQYRVCVDTSPLLEREAAARAGIGWIGKNTLVLHQDLGSYFFLGAVVTTLDLAPDDPVENHCGSCTACLDACPTQAFPAPYEMDAARCISYLTIEHRGSIPPELMGRTGDWLFGCDVCQEVCPFNRHAPRTHEPRLAPCPPAPRIPLETVRNWSPEEYRSALKGTAMKRATLDMWKRNAALVESGAR